MKRTLLGAAMAGVLLLGLSGCAIESGSEKAVQLVEVDATAKANAVGFDTQIINTWDWSVGGYASLVKTGDPDSKTGYDAYWVAPMDGIGLMLRGTVGVPADAAQATPHRATCLALQENDKSNQDCSALTD